MSSLAHDIRVPLALDASVTDDALSVTLDDGRVVSAPLAWFPRLAHATGEERANWRLIGRGSGIHWPAIEEDISMESLIAGRPSGESAQSLRRWLDNRAKRPDAP